MNVFCPSCGSENAVKKRERTYYPHTKLGDTFLVVEEMIICKDCDEKNFASEQARNAYVIAKHNHEVIARLK